VWSLPYGTFLPYLHWHTFLISVSNSRNPRAAEITPIKRLTSFHS
jgi:hypothetical protein